MVIMKIRLKKIKWLFVVSVFLSVGVYFFNITIKEKLALKKVNEVLSLKKRISSMLFETENFPKSLSENQKKYNLEYTIDEDFNEFVRKLLKKYRTDYSSVVVLDNETGGILAAVGYSGKNKKINNSLAFSSTHPSASLIKIITTADLLEGNKVSKSTRFNYKGKGSTLYKYQLADKPSRWSRFVSFEKAFIYSNNVIFGKAAIKKSTGMSLLKMASNFGFNRKIMSNIDMSSSVFEMPKNQYHLAELASGMNKETLMSPVHAALLSSIIANDGVMKKPTLIKRAYNKNENIQLLSSVSKEQVITPKTAKLIKEMMKLTVRKGTARALLRTLKRKVSKNIEIGGKTGSITGGMPRGKRDWLTIFAIPEGQKGISIGIMNVNIKKWHVRSTHLAKRIVEYYYKRNKKPRKSVLAINNVSSNLL